MDGKKRLHWFWFHLIFVLSSGIAFVLWFVFDNMRLSLGVLIPYDTEGIAIISGFFLLSILLGSPAAILTAILSNLVRKKFYFGQKEWVASNLFIGCFVTVIYLYMIGLNSSNDLKSLTKVGIIAAFIASLLIICIEKIMNRKR